MIPYCRVCPPNEETEKEDEDGVGIMKPDIVFFGEGLPDTFHEQLQQDKTEVQHHCVINGRPIEGV